MADRMTLETTQVRRELDTLKSDLSRVKHDLGEVAGAVVGAGRRNSEELKRQMRASARRRMHQLNTTYNQARDASVVAAQRAKQEVSEHPVRSALIALAVGALVASAFGGLRYWRHR